jgi:hypothetical protein
MHCFWLCFYPDAPLTNIYTSGCSLAYAELYLTLAKIIPRFEMELYETTVEDVKPARDFFVPIPNLDSKGVRAKVVEIL